MKKFRVNKKSLALFLAIVTALSATAFAGWNTYQGDGGHNGQITDGAPTGANPQVTSITLPYAGGGWSGVDSEPVMTTVNGATYAYVVYNGRSYGGRLARVNCSDPGAADAVKTVQIAAGNTFQLSTPYLDEENGRIYVASTDYYPILRNNEFDTAGGWTLNGGAVITPPAAGGGEGYVTIPANGAISQEFAYNLTSRSSSQLTSRVILESGGEAAVTYVLERPDGSSVTLATQTVSETEPMAYVEANSTSGLNASGSYTVTVSVTGGTVRCDYVTYSYQTSGVKSFNLELEDERSVAVASYGGQINTPLTVYGNYLYFGAYSGQNRYYQVDLATGRTEIFTGNGGFYWAGAVVVDGKVYFGGDGGYLYIVPVDGFGTGAAEVIDLSRYTGNPGNVRSTIMRYGDDLYFTSQGGYLWKYRPGTGSMIYAAIGAASTSTPVISGNGILYVGVNTSNTAVGSVLARSAAGFTATDTDGKGWTTIFSGENVQSSVITYSDISDKIDYVYFTTNVTDGRGYCYMNDFLYKDVSEIWKTDSGAFTLQGMAAANGYLTFGNDGNSFYIVGSMSK